MAALVLGLVVGDLLVDLIDRLRHEYAYVDADDVHTAVKTLLELLPSFTASYVKWLAEYGVELG